MDPMAIAPRTGSSYPKAHRQQVERRSKRALGDALGLSQYTMRTDRRAFVGVGVA